MLWKKIGKALLFPHLSIMIALTPISAAFLAYSMVSLGSESPVAIISYVIAAYTLTVWCARIPAIVKWAKSFKNENRYARRWLEDERLRIRVSLYGSLIWNMIYAAFQLWLGIYHSTFWYISFAGYYISLAVMRFFLARYTTRKRAGENMIAELMRYRACGWVFLFMNLALSLIVFFMVYWNRTFIHHQITAIAMAAYTFTAFVTAILSVVKYRRYNSPVYSASKVISFAAACVSMLTLSSTMLTTFGDGGMTLQGRRIILGAAGGAVSVLVVAMAIYMIVKGTKKIRALRSEEK